MDASSVHMELMLGMLLRVPAQAIIERISHDQAAAGFDDITPAQFAVFRVLPREGARSSELAARARMTKQSMSALVRALIANGYLRSEPDPDDQRAAIVVRTERGWESERVARESVANITSEWRAALGPELFDAGLEMLRALAKLVEAEAQTTMLPDPGKARTNDS